MSTPPMKPGDHLAAYGLLRQGGGGLERLGLAQALTHVGPCVINGALYDLGSFPGVVEGAGRVLGDLFRVETGAVGPLVDRFEDFDPDDPGKSAYVRRRIKLLEPAGSEAWIYVWTRPVQPDERIASGDWLDHIGQSG